MSRLYNLHIFHPLIQSEMTQPREYAFAAALIGHKLLLITNTEQLKGLTEGR